jgi:hypothetical protein
MPKKRKTIVPFLIIASAVVIALFFVTVRKPVSPAEPLKALPINAMAIVQVNNFKALFEKTSANNQIWNEIKIIPGFDRIDRQLHYLDSLLQFVPEVRDILQNPPSFISAHATGKDRISILHVIQLPSRYGDKNILELVSGLLGPSGTVVNRKYEGVALHEAVTGHSTVSSISWAVSRNILMISFSAIVLEDAIRQLISGESVLDLKGFQEIYATAGKNVDANVFINFSRFPVGLASMVKPEFRAKVRSAKTFAGWAGMDLNLLSDMLLMNGFVNPPDSVSFISSLFAGQKPQKITAGQVLPASVTSFISLSISDPETYFSAYRLFLQEQGKLTAYNNVLQALNETCQTDLLRDFMDIMDNEITLAFDSPAKTGDSIQIYILIRVKSQGLAADKMKNLLEKAAKAESKPSSVYTFDYQLDNEMTFKIFRLPICHLTARLFGGLFSALGEHYFVLMENYLIFGSSVESLRSLIHSQVLNKTLNNDAAYREFSNNLSPRSNILFFNNLSKSHLVYSSYLKSKLEKTWTEYNPVFQKIPALGFQMYTNNSMLYCNFLVKYISSYNQETQTVWESKLDTLADSKPVFVVNHQTGQNEVFVQDKKHSIYLINQIGRILWKVQLPGLINSEVFQVDYFRNGKLQLLFSTRDYIYLIDRKGNFVEKYPIKLRSPATCGVSVFDYENNRDYRLFIACEDKKVYAYSKEGSLVNGWSFDQTESEVSQPVNHFRVGDKDFLVLGDLFRTYILDRKGNTRISTDTFFPHSFRNNYSLYLPDDGSGAGVVTTDTTGKVHFILFHGEIRTVELDRFTGNHFFDYRDLNGDRKMEYIFLDRNRLSVYTSDKNRLFTYTFNESPHTRPVYYQFSSNDRKFGVVCQKENLIYLFNSDGKLYEGFPLEGNTPFSIGNFGDSLARFNLVVGSRDNFLYNYRVK